MTAPVFVVDRARLSAGAEVLLDGPEGRHAATVRRLLVGEALVLTDGSGLVAQCIARAVKGTEVRCEVVARQEVSAPSPRLVVVQALPKGERGETAVETLTEVGVDEIVPWSAGRCVARWTGERGDRSVARWRSAAREAGKQSRRSWFPVVADLASTPVVAARLRGAALAVVLHESAALSLASVTVPASGEVVVVVGPEGGLTDDELAVFAAVGAAAHRLGDSVLRTSTAGTVAAAVLLARTTRWTTASGC